MKRTRNEEPTFQQTRTTTPEQIKSRESLKEEIPGRTTLFRWFFYVPIS
jgi:hypothetical protein